MKTVMLVAIATLFSASALAWDGAECADATERLRRAASDAEDAGQGLASSPSSGSLSGVRSALVQASEYLDRAQRACGARVATPAPKDTTAGQESALRDIEQWTERMKKTDPRFGKIEDILLRHVDFVIRGMPSQYWLPTFQLMYGAAADAAESPTSPPAILRF